MAALENRKALEDPPPACAPALEDPPLVRENPPLVCAACAPSKRRPLADLDALLLHVRDVHGDAVPLRAALPAGYVVDGAGGRVVHGDGAVVVAEKPAGVSTRDFGHAAFLKLERSPGGLTCPQPCHRLDAETGGLVCFGATRDAVAALCGAFAARSVRKEYVAVVCGRLARDGGTIEAPVDGKPATTRYAVLRRDPSKSHGEIATVRLEPVTGRKHQLRKHFARELGAPIAGDRRYMPRVAARGDPGGLLLFARRLQLPATAATAAVDVSAPEPPRFAAFRAAERPD